MPRTIAGHFKYAIQLLILCFCEHTWKARDSCSNYDSHSLYTLFEFSISRINSFHIYPIVEFWLELWARHHTDVARTFHSLPRRRNELVMPAETRCGRAMQSICTLVMCCGCFAGICGNIEHPVIPKTPVSSAISEPPDRSKFASENEYQQALDQWNLAQQAISGHGVDLLLSEPHTVEGSRGASNGSLFYENIATITWWHDDVCYFYNPKMQNLVR